MLLTMLLLSVSFATDDPEYPKPPSSTDSRQAGVVGRGISTIDGSEHNVSGLNPSVTPGGGAATAGTVFSCASDQPDILIFTANPFSVTVTSSTIRIHDIPGQKPDSSAPSKPPVIFDTPRPSSGHPLPPAQLLSTTPSVGLGDNGSTSSSGPDPELLSRWGVSSESPPPGPSDAIVLGDHNSMSLLVPIFATAAVSKSEDRAVNTEKFRKPDEEGEGGGVTCC